MKASLLPMRPLKLRFAVEITFSPTLGTPLWEPTKGPQPGVTKEVVYFLTETTQKEIKPREGEIAEVEWVPLEEAEASLTHENDRTVFRAAMQKIAEEGLPGAAKIG